MRAEALEVPMGEEEIIEKANCDVTRLKQQITFLVKNGLSFPALQEVQRLQGLDNPSGAFRELARAQAKV